MHGVEALPRGPRDVWRALQSARLLISGGGSLLQDVTSARSAVYYAGTMLAASARHVPVAVLGQGLGPLRRGWVRWIASQALGRAALISLRDEVSGNLLQEIGIRRPVARGADLAFLQNAPPAGRGETLLSEAGVSPGRPRVGVAFRPWPGLPDPDALGRAVRTGTGGTIVALPFDRTQDTEASRRVARAGGGTVVEAATPEDLLAVVAATDVVVAVRLHALIFAALCGVPALAIAYDPKVRAFADEIGVPCLLPTASPDEVAHACTGLVQQASVERQRLTAARQRFASLAGASLDALRPWADST
jgi:polysaccharide pyruvyl transferase CsaB